MYNNVWRGVAVTLYALTIFLGPLAAPFMGGFISMSSLGWRWTLYIPSILGFIDVLLILAFVNESYVALILTEKAVEIRKGTGNWAIHSRQERIEFNPRDMIRKYFTRPIKMLFTEPIVFLVSLYMSFIYGSSRSVSLRLRGDLRNEPRCPWSSFPGYHCWCCSCSGLHPRSQRVIREEIESQQRCSHSGVAPRIPHHWGSYLHNRVVLVSHIVTGVHVFSD
jgi:MFS family permease